MALASRLLASGSGWRVADAVCSFGPRDRPYEEQHGAVCIAAVTAGTFRYRSTLGSAVLAPGALLLGNDRHCFECGHEHGVGDRCLSFQFTPEFLQGVVAAVPGARRLASPFRACRRTRPYCRSSPPPRPRARTATPPNSRNWRCVLPARFPRRWLKPSGVRPRQPTRRKAHCRRVAPHRGAGGRAAIAVRSRGRGGDESVSLPAHVPRGGGYDAAPVRPAYAAARRRSAYGEPPTAFRRSRIGRLWRPLDVQPPLSTHRGNESERLSGVITVLNKNAARFSRAASGRQWAKRRDLSAYLGRP